MKLIQRSIIGFAVTLAPLAMAVALALAGYSQQNGAWWLASVHLATLGGITIMIYGVNVEALPTHSGKQWRSLPLVALQVGAGVTGAWIACFGYGYRIDALIRLGHLLALVGAVLFLANLGLLFSHPGARPPRIPWHERTMQQKVDRIAIPFTMLSGVMVVVGTALGLLLDFWRPTFGRWDLVWGHVMLLGFFFAMASGTSYHMVARWSGRDFRSTKPIVLHLIAFVLSFPAMVIALGWDIDWLFLIGGPLMAVSMVAWASNILPAAWPLSDGVRFGIVLAMLFMVAGVGLGVMFAIDPGSGPRLRSTHVIANLFGFSGLLISGFGYRYVPQLAEVPAMRWPGWQLPQLALMATGSALGMLFMALYAYGEAEADAVLWPCLVGTAGMLLFGINTLGTFALKPRNRGEKSRVRRTVNIDSHPEPA